MMFELFSPAIKEILACSRMEADRLHSSEIMPEHLMLGIIRKWMPSTCCSHSCMIRIKVLFLEY